MGAAPPASPGTALAAAQAIQPAPRRIPLHLRFAAAGSVVMLLGMLATGAWVSREIENSVTRNSAISSALYMESFIAPLSQELAGSDTVSAETAARLTTLFNEPHLAGRIASVKIWKPGGLIAYSTDPALIGQRFVPTAPLRGAWAGQLGAAFGNDGHGAEDQGIAPGLPLLEVYNPIHSILTGEIIAVAEFYQIANELEADLFEARLTSWLVVAGVSLTMFALLFGIVRQGSRIIERQTRELQRRVADVTLMSEQNAGLRRRIQAAALRAGEHNERFLRRISAELHDGPAQALALAALRLGGLSRSLAEGRGEAELEVIRSSLTEAMQEIRTICRGLSLPEIDAGSLPEVLRLAAQSHERRTGSAVTLRIGESAVAGSAISRQQRICVYRFVQEGLNNAFRHAGGRGQRVGCSLMPDWLRVSVEDDGPGFDSDALGEAPERLGLRGLRERVESTGGRFTLHSSPTEGTRLEMTLPLDDGQED